MQISKLNICVKVIEEYISDYMMVSVKQNISIISNPE